MCIFKPLRKHNQHCCCSFTNALDVIAIAGGLTEYADSKEITIWRKQGDKTETLKFNYKDVSRGKKLEQNIVLKPGDTVVVP